MAYDLLSKRSRGRDWSLDISDDGDSSLGAELLPVIIDTAVMLGSGSLGPAAIALSVAGHVATVAAGDKAF